MKAIQASLNAFIASVPANLWCVVSHYENF